MILLLDIGNTRIKWTFMRPEGIGEVQAVLLESESETTALCEKWAQLSAPQSIWLSSVVAGHPLVEVLVDWWQEHWGIIPKRIETKKVSHGLRVAYRNESELGVDRWLAMIAIRRFQHGAAMVADCGSALTIDVIDETGEHLGGIITPGLRLMHDALNQGTAAISVASPMRGVDSLLGKDTQTGVLLGTKYALAGTVMQLESRFTLTHKVITGGDAETIIPLLGDGWSYRPHLVLEGIAELAKSELLGIDG